RHVSLDLCRNTRPQAHSHCQRYHVKQFVRYHQRPSLKTHHGHECSGLGTVGPRRSNVRPHYPRPIGILGFETTKFHRSTTEIAFPVYSTVLSGLATGAAEAPCPADTQTILI